MKISRTKRRVALTFGLKLVELRDSMDIVQTVWFKISRTKRIED